MVIPPEQEKSFTVRNGGLTWPFSKPICAKEERNCPAVLTKDFLQLNLEAGILQVHSPTSPSSTLSARAEPNPLGYCQK